MKRIFALISAFFATAVIFSACGNNIAEPSQDDNKNSNTNTSAVSDTADMSQDADQNSPLKIELVGESKVIIKLTHESINEGLANKDESFLAAYEIYFLANDSLKINFRLNRYDSILCSEATADDGSCLWYVDFDQVKVTVSGNTATCEIQMPKLSSYFRECDSYEVYCYKDVEDPIRTDETPPV